MASNVLLVAVEVGTRLERLVENDSDAAVCATRQSSDIGDRISFRHHETEATSSLSVYQVIVTSDRRPITHKFLRLLVIPGCTSRISSAIAELLALTPLQINSVINIHWLCLLVYLVYLVRLHKDGFFLTVLFT